VPDLPIAQVLPGPPPLPQPEALFTEGERVRHERFGEGEVQEIEGDRVTVEFQREGSRTIQASFLHKISAAPAAAADAPAPAG
jgi:hypothetical protein